MDALTSAECGLIRAEHQRTEFATPDDQTDVVCQRCYVWDEPWPCPTIRLLDELDEAWSAIENAQIGTRP